MEWLIVGIVAAVVFGGSLLCLLAIIFRQRLQRLHRIDPATPTDAPLTWVIDPRNPARLHRRLTKVGGATTKVAEDHTPSVRRFRKTASPDAIALVAADLRAQAVALDLQLVRLALLAPRARRQPLADLSVAITEAEAAAARLVAMSAQAQAPRGLDTDPSALGDVTDRITRLAQAHQDLLDLDAGNHIIAQPVASRPLPTRRSPADPAAMPTTGRAAPGQTSPPSAPSPASR
jgi:hypothetical protein